MQPTYGNLFLVVVIVTYVASLMFCYLQYGAFLSFKNIREEYGYFPIIMVLINSVVIYGGIVAFIIYTIMNWNTPI